MNEFNVYLQQFRKTKHHLRLKLALDGQLGGEPAAERRLERQEFVGDERLPVSRAVQPAIWDGTRTIVVIGHFISMVLLLVESRVLVNSVAMAGKTGLLSESNTQYTFANKGWWLGSLRRRSCHHNYVQQPPHLSLVSQPFFGV